MSQASPRSELGDFLRTRRQHIDPHGVGLHVDSRSRRTPGLRREEVSLLSGVSLTWYTWLEQGREVNPSRHVMGALARTLQLTAAEHAYVLHLTGHAIDSTRDHDADDLPAHGQRLLDALQPSPAYALTHDWTIVAWNNAYQRLYPNVAAVPAADRNLLWLVFTDPAVRTLLGDWDTDSQRFLAQFRADAGARVHQPAFADLITRLQEASPQFQHGWESHDVDHFTSRERRFNHPAAGPMTLEHHRMSLSDRPDLHLVVYTAEPGTSSAEKLTTLSD